MPIDPDVTEMTEEQRVSLWIELSQALVADGSHQDGIRKLLAEDENSAAELSACFAEIVP